MWFSKCKAQCQMAVFPLFTKVFLYYVQTNMFPTLIFTHSQTENIYVYIVQSIGVKEPQTSHYFVHIHSIHELQQLVPVSVTLTWVRQKHCNVHNLFQCGARTSEEGTATPEKYLAWDLRSSKSSTSAPSRVSWPAASPPGMATARHLTLRRYSG